jgi:hypothetical protein
LRIHSLQLPRAGVWCHPAGNDNEQSFASLGKCRDAIFTAPANDLILSDCVHSSARIISDIAGEKRCRPLCSLQFWVRTMFRSVLAAALVFPAILSASPRPAMANECEEAAQRVKKDARAANISPELAAQVNLAIEKALQRRKSGDSMGCLSGMEEARKIFEVQ